LDVTVGIDEQAAGGLVVAVPVGEHQHRRARTGPRHPGVQIGVLLSHPDRPLGGRTRQISRRPHPLAAQPRLRPIDPIQLAGDRIDRPVHRDIRPTR